MSDDLVEGKRATVQARRQGLALEQLHHEEPDASLVSDVVERADTRVGEPRQCARLALESLLQTGLLGDERGQDLDGYGAVETGVLRPVDLAHASRAQWSLDFIRPEAGTR